MTEVLPGDDGPGDDPEPYVPTGARRSTFTPPAVGTEPPAFDDDALADALAAQVAAYTSPVTIIPPTAPVVEEAPAVEDPEPAPPAPEPVDLTTSSTLDAIERLEQELRRRAGEPSPIDSAPPEPEAAETQPAEPEPVADETSRPEGPLFPAPPTYLRAAPPEAPAAPPVAELPEPPESAAVDAPPALVEPPAFAPPAPTEPPPAPSFGAAPATPPVDLPPPAPAGALDFAHLPPPIGLEPAPIPPYDPTADNNASSGAEPGAVAHAPHPDDLHPDDLGGPGAAWTPPLDPRSSSPAPLPDEDDDVVDEVDRAFGPGAHVVDPTGAVTVVAPPSQPIPTARLAEDEPGIADAQPQQHPVLLVESSGVEPTPLDLRAGRAARLFWLWFAANSSVVSLSLGAVLFGLGMSLRQALVAILIGVALSFLPLGLGTLAGKWSGQPTMIVSRATFGLTGNTLPAAIAVLSRVFWGGALLWMLAAGVARVLVDAGLDAGLGELVWTFVGLGVGFVLAAAIALFGYGLLARVQLVLSILTALLVVGLIALTFPHLDIAAAQGVSDGPWILLVTGVVLVFSFVGLAWVHSSADVARYQRPDSDGGSTMLWATFGATLPAFVLVAWGALLAASDPIIADGLATNPIHTIAALLPIWYPAPLLAAIALGLISAVVLTIYSGGFALQSLGLRLRRPGVTAIAGGLVLLAAVALMFVAGDARGLIRDAATTIAVPVAAWAGILATEMMIRRRRFHADSLLRRGGVYPAVRWVNVAGLVVITALGFGFTSAALPGLDWQGYLWPLLGLPAGDPLLTSDIGVLGALVLGILLPLVSAVPAIRRQEDASVD